MHSTHSLESKSKPRLTLNPTKTPALSRGFFSLRSNMNKIHAACVVGVLLFFGIYLAYDSAGPNLTAVGVKKSPTTAPAGLHHNSLAPSISIDSKRRLSANESASAYQNSIPDPLGKQAILDAIQLASVSYDPSELPSLKPYLTHSDPEIREAALNGIIVLGHAAGAPLLRDAASRISNPIEASELLRKADYLELPSAPIKLLKQRLQNK
jgi:hypothetical protein